MHRVRPLALCLTLLASSALANERARPVPPPVERLQITAVGDVNLGTAFPSEDYLPPDGGASLLSDVREYFTGDVVFGNLEGPLTEHTETVKCGKGGNCYAFRTPTSYVKHLVEARFDVLSLANNHANDFGPVGREETMRVLDEAGIRHSGVPGSVAVWDVRGRKVGMIAFTTYPHSHNLLDLETSKAQIAELAQKVDIVIVSFHGGDEGSRATKVEDAPEKLGNEARGHLMAFARTAVDAGADLVLGHGPHVLRGAEIYKDRLIAYSLGNFVTYGRFNLRGLLGVSVVLNVELDPETGRFLGADVHSTKQIDRGVAVKDPSNQGWALLEKLSNEDFPWTRPTFVEGNRLEPPPGTMRGLFAADTVDERARLRTLLDDLSAKHGLSRDDLVRWFSDDRAQLFPDVTEKMERPAEKTMTWERYRSIFWRDEVLARGRAFLEEHKELLDQVEAQYGVDRSVLVGLAATETRVGVNTGDYVTFNALATLAMRYDRRRDWATRELAALLKLFPDDPFAVKGSYAGAVGYVQFMPTSIQAYGVDRDGDGKIDLASWPDALASAANYLAKHGFRKGGSLEAGQANHRAILKYNPAAFYARIVSEFALEFAGK